MGTDTPSLSSINVHLGHHHHHHMSSKVPRWLHRPLHSPVFLLCYFFVLNLLNYFDRGAMAAVAIPVEKEFELDKTELGFIASAFMIGFMIFSPLFAHLAARTSANKTLALGMTLWSIACICTGSSDSYSMLLFSRIFVGVGEASFAGLAPTCIDDIAPPHLRTTWLSIFYIGIPVGVASGYLGSTFFSVFSDGAWRPVFWMAGALMLPLAVLILFMPNTKHIAEQYTKIPSTEDVRGGGVEDPHRDRDVEDQEPSISPSVDPNLTDAAALTIPQQPAETDTMSESSDSTQPEEPMTLIDSIVSLMTNPIYVLVCFGYAAISFVVGGLSVFAPIYFHDYVGLTIAEANVGFSICGVTTGIVGTWFGGYVLDKFGGGSKGLHGTSQALKFSFYFICLSFPTGVLIFMTRSPPFVFVCLWLCQFFMFCTTAPVNGALLSAVPVRLRSFCMSFSLFVTHFFGDFPSPVIIGALADHYGDARFNVAMLTGFMWLSWAILLWYIAWHYNTQQERKLEKQKD